MKNYKKFKSLITLFFISSTILFFNGCSDNGSGWADERYLENFELSWDNPNPKTGLPYTEAEIAALKYDRSIEERYKGDQPVILNLLTSKQIKEVKVYDGSNLSLLLTIKEAQADGDKFRVNIVTSLQDLEIEDGKGKALKFDIIYSDESIGSTQIKITSILPLPPTADILKGHWEFNDASNFLKATIGNDLTLGGNNGVTSVSGINASDGAALTSVGGYINANHGLPAKGGSKVNEYTLILDVSFPVTAWANLLQTVTDNSGDGSLFVEPSGWLWANGFGYSGSSAVKHDGTWHRIVITAAEGDFRVYVDGIKFIGASSGVDGIHALDLSKFLLFADNNGEDAPVKVTEVMLFDITFANEWITDDVPPVGVALP